MKGIVHVQDVSFVYANTEDTHVRAFTVALAAVQTLEPECACLMYAFPELLRSQGGGLFPSSNKVITIKKQAGLD